jgi:ribosomal protein S21
LFGTHFSGRGPAHPIYIGMTSSLMLQSLGRCLASAAGGASSASCMAPMHAHAMALGSLPPPSALGMVASSSGRGAISSGRGAMRSYAVEVEVRSGNVVDALAQLRRKCADAELFTELRKRDHHLNPSERRFGRQRASYNRAMGRNIMERVGWLTKRRHSSHD